MRRRLERRIEAFRDGGLPGPQARRIKARVEQDMEAARILGRTDALGQLVREAWTEGPEGPDPDALIDHLRPGLLRVDRELADRPIWRPPIERAARWIRPAVFAGATAAALFALTILPTLYPPAEGPGVAQADTPVRSLRAPGAAVMVIEGGDGVTIIWVLDQEDIPDSSRQSRPGGWA